MYSEQVRHWHLPSLPLRLQGCQPDVETWQRILQVRALVLNPEDDPVMWIKFANLCRKSDRMALAEKTINSLLSPERVCKQLNDATVTSFSLVFSYSIFEMTST